MNMVKQFGILYRKGGNDRLDSPYFDAVEHFESGQPVFNEQSTRSKRGGRNMNPDGLAQNSSLSS